MIWFPWYQDSTQKGRKNTNQLWPPLSGGGIASAGLRIPDEMGQRNARNCAKTLRILPIKLVVLICVSDINKMRENVQKYCVFSL